VETCPYASDSFVWFKENAGLAWRRFWPSDHPANLRPTAKTQSHLPCLRRNRDRAWNFSPPNSIREVEEYRVELSGVTVLELVIVPGGSRLAPESARVSTRCSSMVTPNTRRAWIGEFQLPAQSLCRRLFPPVVRNISRTCSFSISACFLASSTCVSRSRSNPNDTSLKSGMVSR